MTLNRKNTPNDFLRVQQAGHLDKKKKEEKLADTQKPTKVKAKNIKPRQN